MRSEINRVAVLGTGLIGAGWAAFYASKGLKVRLYDVDKSQCLWGHQKAIEYLTFLLEKKVLSTATFERATGSLRCAESVDALVDGADLVQESVSERYEIKTKIFRELEENASSDCIFASSSSGLLASEMQKGLAHPERLLIVHPFNPPHLIPLVELVPGKQTDPGLVSFVAQFYEDLGKNAIILNKEVPGHVANRLQAALWREAIQLVLDGVASLEDIDKAVSAGPGLRWALMGPHKIFHLGGGDGGIGHFVDHVGVSFEKLWEDMANWDRLPDGTREGLVAGIEASLQGRDLKELAAWRDDKLTSLLQVIEE